MYVICIVEECQKRWKTLRERYVKENKKKSGDKAKVCVQWELLSQWNF